MKCEDIIQRGTEVQYRLTFAKGLEGELRSVTLTWGVAGRKVIDVADMAGDEDGYVFTFDTSAMFGMVRAEASYDVDGLRRTDKQPMAFVKEGSKPVYIVQGVGGCCHEVRFTRVMDAGNDDDYLCDTDGVRLVTSEQDYIIIN